MTCRMSLFLLGGLVALFVTGAVSAGADSPKLLVETANLANLQEENSGDLLVLDRRPKDDYLQGHIPGAVHFDYEAFAKWTIFAFKSRKYLGFLMELRFETPISQMPHHEQLSEERNGVRGLLKATDALARVLAEAGIDPAKHVVLHSGMADSSDAQNATRAFWVLDYLSYPRVAILDGGRAEWKYECRPIEHEPVFAAGLDPSALSLAPRSERLVMQEELIVLQDQDGAAKSDFAARAGHIPGAANVPASSLLEARENGAYYIFRAAQELEAALRGAVPDTARRIVTYCNSGRDASVGCFGALLGGRNNVASYEGSMAEWGSCS